MPLPQPEFLEAPERRLVALSREFTPKTSAEMPGLWDDFWSRGWELPGEVEQACYGVSYSSHQCGHFFYAAALNVEPIPDEMPKDACVVTLSAGRYAVFRERGPLQEIPGTFDAIFATWLPNSGETQREGAVFERYPYNEDGPPETVAYEIWVPIAR